MSSKNQKRPFWVFPWGYRESFAIVIAILFSGTILGFVLKKEVEASQYPANIISGGILIAIILICFFTFRKTGFVKWLSGSKAAISSISLYLLLITLMGFIPQNQPDTNQILFYSGLSHITSSFTFLFAQIYLLLVLGLVTMRKANSFRLKSIGFFLNHFGLWLTLFAAGLGNGDIQRFTMEINTQNPAYEAYDSEGKSSGDLGIAILLEEFVMEVYPPKSFVIDAETGDILLENPQFLLEKGGKGKLGKYEIEVIDFIENGVGMGEKFLPVYDVGAAPAALVKVKDNSTGKEYEEWISCGSFRFPGNFIQLSEKELLVMAEPEAKSYKSKVKIYTKDGDIVNDEISVGKPVSINGWKIYQVSYNEKMGKWSDISVVELVKDPWLIYVYIGLFMLIAGSIFLIVTGESFSNRKTNAD